MNIDEMPAGPELDAMVAEKVMGIDVGEPLKAVSVAEIASGPNREFGTTGIPIDYVRHYSTDIAAAWEVVDKLLPTCAVDLSTMIDKTWHCELTVNDRFEVEAYAPTTPLAICRAALKAVL